MTTDGKALTMRPGLIASAVALPLAVGMSIWGWIQIPDDALLPVHWGASGQPDRFAGKAEALIPMPAAMLGLCVLFFVLPRVLPRRSNLADSKRVFNATWIGVLVLLCGLHLVMLLNATGGELPVVRFVILGLGGLFLVLGNYLPKTRSNWAVGVRTPWTMESEHSWRETHRLTGRLFAGVGLVLIIVAFLVPVAVLAPIVIVGTVAVGVVPAVYSWWTWRADSSAGANR